MICKGGKIEYCWDIKGNQDGPDRTSITRLAANLSVTVPLSKMGGIHDARQTCALLVTSVTWLRLDIPRTKQMESRMFDLPVPLKPVMALK